MRFLTSLPALALAFIAAGCAEAPSKPAADRPRLVVQLIVDGLPQWQVTRYRDQLGSGGLRRFLDEGSMFTEAHYTNAYTVTAVGHATIATGAYPRATGIIGNEWHDPVTGAQVYCTQDESATYIDAKGSKFGGTSPKLLQAETVGDVLRTADPRSKVLGISGKDRGAIIPAGHKGTAYMFIEESGIFASTTYYMPAHPQWVKDFNAKKPADAYFRKPWTPLRGESEYGKSLADGQAWFPPGGKFPIVPGHDVDAPGPKFYGALLVSPYADQLTFDFARAAIAAEQLGQDDAPDLLSISLSAHDYVNHSFGAESRISHDHVLQLDRQLAAFFADLDKTVGRGNYVAVLTADHGFMPVPEHTKSLGQDGGRFDSRAATAAVEKALSAKFGEGKWVRRFSTSGLLLDHALIEQKKLPRRAVEDEAKVALVALPGVHEVATRTDLEGLRVAGEMRLHSAVQKGFFPGRSADLFVTMKPNWMMSSRTTGTTHGSPHAYDTHVPILLYGPGWIPVGTYQRRVDVADIAPTLARLLKIAPPRASEGRVLEYGPGMR